MNEAERVRTTIEGARASRALARDALRGKPGRRKAARTAALCLAAFLGLSLAFPPFLVPVEGRVSSPFFFRFAPDRTLPALEFHDAVDIAVPAGTPVRAMAPGVVEAAGWDDSAGNYVSVRHPFGLRSFYGHLSSVSVKPKQLILVPFLGRIGKSGSTGRSTGPHLHFAVRLGKLPLPPDLLLAAHRIRLAALGF